ncbi:MAG: rhomboid family intramembrane serine protease [Bacteroidetes bacterium]|nr:rhomboid family intramembrane serine protease [Bacteroidota bacterium]
MLEKQSFKNKLLLKEDMRFKTAVMPLIGINLLFFILQVVLGDGFTQVFVLIGKDVFTRPWILLTSMFLHGGFNHIFFNMYALFLFGPMLEHRIGAKRFLIVYLGSGLIAGFLASFVYPAALGASGAIMGMIGALIIVMPHLRLLFFFFIPMPLWIAGIVWAFLDAIGVFYPSGVGNVAHLVGMGAGLLYGLHLKQKKQQYDVTFKSKTHMDVEDLEEYFKTGRI